MRELTVAICAPGDLEGECQMLYDEIIPSVSQELGDLGLPFSLRPLWWRRDAVAGVDPKGGQAIIDRELKLHRRDAVIVIFWRRFGEGSTGHELRLAEQENRLHGRPRIFMCFNEAGPLPRNMAEHEQYEPIVRLRHEYEAKGLLVPFNGSDQFEAEIRRNLIGWCQQLANAPPSPAHVPLTCTVSTSVRLIRDTSVSELVGDLILTFSGGLPCRDGGTEQVFDFLVFTSPKINVTNPIGPDKSTDAVFVPVDERDSGRHARGAIWGSVHLPNAILFRRIRIDPPGTGLTRTFVISGVRVNASQLGQHAGSSSAVSLVVDAVPMGSSQPLRFRTPAPTTGLTFNSSLQCSVANVPDGATGAPALSRARAMALRDHRFHLILTVRGPFRTLIEEAGFQPAPTHQPQYTSTRILLRVVSIPRGVTVLASDRDVQTNGMRIETSDYVRAVRVEADVNGAGDSADFRLDTVKSRGATLDWTPVAITGGAGHVVWEWVAESGGFDQVSFGLAVQVPLEAASGLARFSCSLAPISWSATASPSAPVPRFVDTAATQALFEIAD